MNTEIDQVASHPPEHGHAEARRGPGRRWRGAVLRSMAAATVPALAAYVLAVAPSGGSAADAASTSVAAGSVPSSAVPSSATGSTPAPEHPVPPPARAQRQPVMGISVPTTEDLDRFITTTGTRPEVVDTFEAWSLNRPLQRGLADTVAARGAQLSVTWEPWDSTGSHTDQPRYSLASITAGRHDAYIDMYAESVKQYGHPVTIRLMHEMNGTWYPWGNGVNGNRPGQFVAAWRHVQDRFDALEVPNVTWMWAPNGLYRGSASLAGLYPGDAHVDLVGISNYNWGNQRRGHHATKWRSFDSLFGPSIAAVRSLTARPIWISETGSSNSGGSKAQWLAETFAELQHRPEIAGVVWFDHVDQARDVDWRIETEADAIAAWRHAFDSRRLVTTTRKVAG